MGEWAGLVRGRGTVLSECGAATAQRTFSVIIACVCR